MRRIGSPGLCVLLLVAALGGLVPGPAAGAEEAGLLDVYRTSRENDQATRAYHQGKYEEARAGYMRAKDLAGEQGPDGYRLHFNIGSTFYKEGNYDQAEKEFSQAVASDDLALREQAYYNLGNVYFQKGLAGSDLELLKKAVEHYQKALELNPDDEDAKFNIEVVRRHLDLKQNQPPPQGGACPNPKSGKQEQQGQQGQPQDQAGAQGEQQPKPASGQEQQPPAGEKKEEKPSAPVPQPGGTAQPQPQEQKQPAKPAGSDQTPDKLSEEEAKRLLQAVQEWEKEDMKKVIEANRTQQQPKDKDW